MTTDNASAESNPTYLYKLVHHADPPSDPLPECLPLSRLDQDSGFIHLSTAHQIPGTLKHFFTKDPRVFVLKIAFQNVAKDIRWENPNATVCGDRPGEGLFPHLYNGGRLGHAEIESVATWENGEDGWDKALEGANAWLVY
ncbi:hypothetical protein BDN72DRAFT_831481 [Pluteus cervinus]|uniref:Uncharacterized protein n=1 Tax=Pluteus cervinus TaxID=181527 RepID=A0ACD3BDE4_9AGAR|nr:hypothetical protein BDN72DRAFT_831481 [Pluteus cervinus]